MLLNLNQESEPHKSTLVKIAAVASSGLLLVVLIGTLRGASQVVPKTGGGEIGLVKNLGQVLFNEFLFPFEVSSILLLAAMVGVVMIGKDEEHTKPNS